MTDAIRVLLVDDADDIRETERRMLAYDPDIEIVSECGNGADAIKRAAAHKPDIVLMDINMPVMDGIEATRRIADELPGVAVVIVSVEDEFESLKKAMQAGAKEYLLKPFAADSMISAIKSVYARQEKRQRVTTTAILSDRLRSKSHIATFFSAKGGVGKTTAAVNAGVLLAGGGRKTVVVDLDMAFGDVAMLLGLDGKQRNLYSLMLEGEGYMEALPRYLQRHESGLYVLAAPEAIEQGEYITPQFIKGVTEALRRDFDYVLLDTAPMLHDVFFATLDAADAWYLFTAADLASAKNNRRLLDVLQTLGYDPARAQSVYVLRGSLPERAAAEVIGMETRLTLAYESGVAGPAVDLGVPLVLRGKQTRLHRDLRRLVASIAADESRTTMRDTRGIGGIRRFLPYTR